MVFEKTAKKREEAAAGAALRAVQSGFKKFGKGLDYLEDRIRDIKAREEEHSSAIENRQDAVENHIENLYDEIGKREAKEAQLEGEIETHSTRMNRVEQKLIVRCSCGAFLSPLQLVCHECGAISEEFPFKLEQFDGIYDVAAQCQSEALGLSGTIQQKKSLSEECVYKQELANEIFTIEQIYSIVMSYISRNDKRDIPPIYRRIEQKTKSFLDSCRSSRIEVAVVGTVKAGKSSLINALLGAPMASVNPTPETSVLVKYRTTPDKNYIRVQFYTSSKWKNLWKTVKANSVFQSEYKKAGADKLESEYLDREVYYEECQQGDLPERIMRWTSSQSPEHFFVRELEVGYQGDAFHHDVVLVDTPGLGDPVKYRSNITREYIKDSDSILACIANENLSSKYEIDFLTKIAGNKSHQMDQILVVATKADALTDDECKQKQDLFLKQISQLYGSEGSAVNHFVSVSAECHTIMGQFLGGRMLDPKDEEKLRGALNRLRIYNLSDISSHKTQIYDYAGIQNLSRHINNLIFRERRKALISELKKEYEQTIRGIKSEVKAESDSKGEDLYRIITDSLDIEKRVQTTEKEIEELEARNREVQDAIKGFRTLSAKISPKGKRGMR